MEGYATVSDSLLKELDHAIDTAADLHCQQGKKHPELAQVAGEGQREKHPGRVGPV
jgi:hypothetical protein